MAGATALEMVTSLPTDSLHAEWLELGMQFKKVKVACGSLCTSLHKDPYAQCPVMNSFGSLVAAFTVKSRI